MYRGTTPTIRWYITTEELDFDNIEKVWMTLKDAKGNRINAPESDIEINSDERYIEYTLSQKQTLDFRMGTLKLQLRVLLKDGQALASEINEIEVKGILRGGVI